MSWIQAYDPLGNAFLRTLVATLPIVVLLLGLGLFEWRAHVAALVSVLVALGAAIFICGMPVSAALASVVFGAADRSGVDAWIFLSVTVMLWGLPPVKALLQRTAIWAVAVFSRGEAFDHGGPGAKLEGGQPPASLARKGGSCVSCSGTASPWRRSWPRIVMLQAYVLTWMIP